ncbi:MAG: hypothetical protein J2P57_11590 [Acidimicrobiaceae bacterium]|nr:hypothetical protein [Acidimicrobiaceae bacterium]
MRRNSQRGQALPAVLVIMTLVFMLAGGVTMAVSALVQQRGPNHTQTANDLAPQNAVAATAADVQGAGSHCGTPAEVRALAAPPFGDWSLQGLSSTAAGLSYVPPQPGQPSIQGTASELFGDSSSGYTVTAEFNFPNGMPYGTSIELDAGQSGGAPYLITLQQAAGQSGHPLWQVGSSTGTATSSTLPRQQPSSVTSVSLELDVIGGLVTGRIIGAWNPAPSILVASLPVDTVTVAVTSTANVDVTSVEVDRGIPATQSFTPPYAPAATTVQCQRLDQVSLPSLLQKRIDLAPSPVKGCLSRVSSAPFLTIDPNEQVILWLTVAWPQGTQTSPLRLDLATTTSQCPYSTNGTNPASAANLADCGNQRSTQWYSNLSAVAGICTGAPSQVQSPADYYLYVTALSGQQTPSASNLAQVDVHWAAGGSDSSASETGSIYMTVASLPTGYEESDLSLSGDSMALTYEGPPG